jgi:hypothetical protein
MHLAAAVGLRILELEIDVPAIMHKAAVREEIIMSYEGHVVNGIIHLDHGVSLPEGAAVRVELVPGHQAVPSAVDAPSQYDSLAPFVGKAEGLPADMSVNLDHYLYGTPKRS